ncbi:MAG: formylglycine-generating enzyme family protein [Methylococcaceae bacterium]
MRINKTNCLLLIALLSFFTDMANAKPERADLAKPDNNHLNLIINKPANNKASVVAQELIIKPSKPPRIGQQKGAALTPLIVNIRPGCFQMGSPETEQGRSADEELHRVCVKAFKLSRNELTVEEFRKFITATHFITDAERNTEEMGCWSYKNNPDKHWDWWKGANWKQPVQGVEVMENAPVTCVSLLDVMAYIDWLNKETGQQYRLPTEAEWEYAARGGTATARYWGNNPDIACSYSNVADHTTSGDAKWPEIHDCEDGYFFNARVSALRANKFDLYDVLGNVWEWTCSKYEEKYTGSEEACTDIKQEGDMLIAFRGGGWNADPPRVRAASRNWGTAWTRQANLGFRLVRVR